MNKYFYPASFIAFVISFIIPGTISFWNEMHQSISAILCSIFLIFYAWNENFKFRKFQIFFIIMLISSIINHIIFHTNNSKSYIIVGSIYIICCIRVQQIFENIKIDVALKYLACALLTITSLSLIIQFYQSLGISQNYWPWMYSMSISSGSRPYANIGQPNILASIYVTSLCAIFWATHEKLLSIKYTYLFGAICSIGVAFTQSRTGYLSIIFLSLLFLLQKKSSLNKKLYFPFIFICCLISSELIQNSTGMNRELSENLNNQRFSLWLIGLDAIRSSPLVGYGFHETARAAFHVIENSPIQHILVSQIHNIFIDIFIWFGIPIGAILCAILIKSYYEIIQKSINKNYIYPLMALTPFSIHSLLEYPLYYANNLVLFSMIIGMSYAALLED